MLTNYKKRTARIKHILDSIQFRCFSVSNYLNVVTQTAKIGENTKEDITDSHVTLVLYMLR